MTQRARWGWGIAATLFYGAVAFASFEAGLFPARPLYEGVAPAQPYRWVDPPEGFEETNLPPEPAKDVAEFIDGKSDAKTLQTFDQQALLIVNQGAFAPSPGQTGVELTIDPLDPKTIGEPPKDLHYDSNAYRIRARYVPSGMDATATGPMTVMLRWAFGAQSMYRWEANAWVKVERTTPNSQLLAVYGTVTQLGDFVIAGPPLPGSDDGKRTDIIAAGAGIAVVIVGVVLTRLRASKQRKRRPPLKKPPPRAKRRR